MRIRVGAYGVAHDERGLLLVHFRGTGDRSDQARRSAPVDVWTLPGGGLDPYEDPVDAVVRELAEETGYTVEVGAPLVTASRVLPAEQRFDRRPEDLQMLSIVYRVTVVGGELRDEADGSTDRAAWVPLADLDTLPHIPLVDLAVDRAGLTAS